jgi:uncharacterized protein YggE
MRMLKVQGRGQVNVEPDMVTLSFNVENTTSDYAECLQGLNKQTEDLRRNMSASGLLNAKLKTSYYNISIETRYDDKRHPIFNGYSASHRMQIELPSDKELLNKVLREVAKGHSGAEISLSFSVKDKDALRQRVITQAVQMAKENAETLAAAAGVTLGKLQEINYGCVEVRVYEQESRMTCPSAMENMAEPDIDPADVNAEDSVTLVYEIT